MPARLTDWLLGAGLAADQRPCVAAGEGEREVEGYQPDRDDSGALEWVAPLHLRSIFPQELPVLLGASGFRLRSRAGDLRGGAFTSASPRQVCVCEPAAPAA